MGAVPALGGSGWLLLLSSPILGSFVGVLIRRLPDGLPIACGRSACEACGTVLTAPDLVPIVSWLAMRGRCRHCRAPLGWFYPAVEVAAVAVAGVSLALDRGADAWLDALFGLWLLALAWIDLRCWLLPDFLTLPLIGVGLVAAALWAPGDLGDRVAGAVCGYLGLRLAGWAYRRWRGRDGLGGGDAKLLAAAGAWVGATGLPTMVFGGAATALAVVAVLALGGRPLRRDTAVPFGPFLALAAWLVWLFGPLM